MLPNRLSDLTIVVVEDHDDGAGIWISPWIAWVQPSCWRGMGLKAFRQQRISRPNLVVSDIQMPGMNGFELLRAIRAFGPDAGGNVSVIAMTSFVPNVIRARILNSGFQACLPKPFTPDKLAEVILIALNN